MGPNLRQQTSSPCGSSHSWTMSTPISPPTLHSFFPLSLLVQTPNPSVSTHILQFLTHPTHSVHSLLYWTQSYNLNFLSVLFLRITSSVHVGFLIPFLRQGAFCANRCNMLCALGHYMHCLLAQLHASDWVRLLSARRHTKQIMQKQADKSARDTDMHIMHYTYTHKSRMH
jgi:hypothetical protein